MSYCLRSQWLSNDVFHGKLEPHPPKKTSCLSYLDEEAPFATALFCSDASSFLFASQKPVTLGDNVQTTWAESETLGSGSAWLGSAHLGRGMNCCKGETGHVPFLQTRRPLCFVMVISQPVADICVRPAMPDKGELRYRQREKGGQRLNNRRFLNHYWTLPLPVEWEQNGRQSQAPDCWEEFQYSSTRQLASLIIVLRIHSTKCLEQLLDYVRQSCWHYSVKSYPTTDYWLLPKRWFNCFFNYLVS